MLKIAFNECNEYNDFVPNKLGELDMAMLTIRNVDDALKTQIRIRAAEHGWSMEEEVRRILQAVVTTSTKKGLGSRIHQVMMKFNAPVDLELPERSLPRPAPDFSGDDL